MRRSIALIGVVAVLAAACSGGSQDLARVGDAVVTVDDISDLYETSSIPAGEDFRNVLFRLMALEALVAAFESDVGPLDEEEVDAQFEEFLGSITASGSTIEVALGMDGAGEGMLRVNAEVFVIRNGVISMLAVRPENIEQIFNDGLTVTEVCVRHILTATEEELQAAVERIEGGEDFAAVATEVSLDTATVGGNLGCNLAGGYVPEFAQAAVEGPIGELQYPVETDFGFHALIVDERRELATYEEVAANPLEYISDTEANALWQEWFNEVLQAADAEVLDPARYGTWSPVGIVPPEEG